MAKLHGPWAGRVTRSLIMFNWFMLMSYFLVALANTYSIIGEEIQSSMGAPPLCSYWISLIAAATIAPAMQVRTFHHMALMSTVSLLGMIAMVGSLSGWCNPEVLTDAAITQIGIGIAALALYPEPGKEAPAVADLFPKEMVREPRRPQRGGAQD